MKRKRLWKEFPKHKPLFSGYHWCKVEKEISDEDKKLVNDTLAGKYGNCEKRMEALGENYDKIQGYINEIIVNDGKLLKKEDELLFYDRKNKSWRTCRYYGTVRENVVYFDRRMPNID